MEAAWCWRRLGRRTAVGAGPGRLIRTAKPRQSAVLEHVQHAVLLHVKRHQVGKVRHDVEEDLEEIEGWGQEVKKRVISDIMRAKTTSR